MARWCVHIMGYSHNRVVVCGQAPNTPPCIGVYMGCTCGHNARHLCGTLCASLPLYRGVERYVEVYTEYPNMGTYHPHIHHHLLPYPPPHLLVEQEQVCIAAHLCTYGATPHARAVYTEGGAYALLPAEGTHVGRTDTTTYPGEQTSGGHLLTS